MLFREFFKLVKINTLGRNIEIYMADILVAVIDEAHTIPSDALHTIINQLIDYHPFVVGHTCCLPTANDFG